MIVVYVEKSPKIIRNSMWKGLMLFNNKIMFIGFLLLLDPYGSLLNHPPDWASIGDWGSIGDIIYRRIPY